MNLDDVMSSTAILIPLCTGIVQAIKMILNEKHHKWSSLIAIVIGIILSYFTNMNDDSNNYNNFSESLLAGVTIGLASAGLYSGLKSTMKNGERTID